MRDTIEMAREAKMPFYWRSGEITYLERLKVFEALVRADERKIVMSQPLTKEMWQRFEDEIRADEREGIAEMFDAPMRLIPFVQNTQGGCVICGFTPSLAAAAIRARGETK